MLYSDVPPPVMFFFQERLEMSAALSLEEKSANCLQKVSYGTLFVQCFGQS